MKRKPALHHFFSFFLALAWCGLLCQPIFGQVTPTVPPTPAPTPAVVDPFKPKQDQVAQEIQAVSQSIKTFSATDTSEIKGTLARRLELLQRIALSYSQQATALQARQTLQASKEKAEAENNQGVIGTTADSRPTFLGLEKMRDELSAETERGKTVKSRVDARQSSLDDARKAFDETEKARRQSRDAAEGAKDTPQAVLLNEKLLTAIADSRSASETVRLRDIELGNEKLDQEIYQIRLAILKKKVEWWKEQALFVRQDLIEVVTQIEKREKDLQARKQTAESEKATAESRLSKATERMDATAEPDQALREEVEARRRERATRQREIATLGDRLQRLADMKKVWEYRYRVINREATPQEMKAWADEATQMRAQCDLEHPPQMALVSDLRRELRSLEEKTAASKEAGSQVLRWLGEQKRHLENLIRLEEENGLSMEEAWRLYTRFISEIAEEQAGWRIGEWFSLLGSFLSAVWNKELTESKDNPLTVQKLITAIFLFIVGIWVSRRATRALEQRVLNRLPLPVGTASILKSLTYYLTLALATLVALKVADVPLTLFAFLGGALAIGLGFGSQHIISNFISGLILLIERPIQEGDQIEYSANNVGTVIRIGPRCTHVRTGNNIDIFIPNSFLLQNNVVNRTRTDDKVRVQVTVPVQYGSTTREVAKILRKAADDHGKVLKKPDPVVLLRNFGADGLEFQLQFWIQTLPGTDLSVVESDIRFMIDSHFREAGILMPYPQRDVHLLATEPLQVQIGSFEKESSS